MAAASTGGLDVGEDEARGLAAGLRDKINNAEILSTRRVLVIGRAGSGKTSLLRSLYFAHHETTELPRDMTTKLLVAGGLNEGTTTFNAYSLWPTTEGPKARSMERQLVFLDSRGMIDGENVTSDRSFQHWQLKALLQGQFAENGVIAVEERPWLAFWRSRFQVPQNFAADELIRLPSNCVVIVDDFEAIREWMNLETGALGRLKDLIRVCQTAQVPFVVVITKIDVGQPGTRDIVADFLKENLKLDDKQCFIVENYHDGGEIGELIEASDVMKHQFMNLIDTVSELSMTCEGPTLQEVSVGGCVIG